MSEDRYNQQLNNKKHIFNECTSREQQNAFRLLNQFEPLMLI